MNQLPPFHSLVDTFEYDVLNGVLVWRKAPGCRYNLIGRPVGNLTPDGYRTVKFKQRNYRHCRLVHMFITGQDPYPKEIDHINREHGDDHIWNLRPVTPMQNCANRDNQCYHVQQRDECTGKFIVSY